MGFRDDGHSIQTYLRIPLDLNELQNILHYQCGLGKDKKDVCENIDGCSYWEEDYGGDCISDEVGIPHVEYLIIKVPDKPKPDFFSDKYIKKRLVQKRKEALTKHRLESKYPPKQTQEPSVIPYSTQKSHTVPWTAPGDDVLPIEIINKITSYMD